MKLPLLKKLKPPKLLEPVFPKYVILFPGQLVPWNSVLAYNVKEVERVFPSLGNTFFIIRLSDGHPWANLGDFLQDEGN